MDQKILIIEDEDVVCDLLTRFLEERHYKVECAKTLAAGMDKVKTFHPTIVLLDNNLPDGKGVDLIASLKELQSGLHIIVLSAMDGVGPVAIEQGAEYFIRKPFGFRQVYNAIQQTC